MQRFLRLQELGGSAAVLTAQIVTEKLDGTMVHGMAVDGQVELWTRGGWTQLARAATRVGAEQGELLQLIGQVDSEGGTATFEFVGHRAGRE